MQQKQTQIGSHGPEWACPHRCVGVKLRVELSKGLTRGGPKGGTKGCSKAASNGSKRTYVKVGKGMEIRSKI